MNDNLILWTTIPPGIGIFALLLIWIIWGRKRIVWHTPTQMIQNECNGCNGTGVQWLDPDYGFWMPIPKTHINIKLTHDVRECEKCGGLGHLNEEYKGTR